MRSSSLARNLSLSKEEWHQEQHTPSEEQHQHAASPHLKSSNHMNSLHLSEEQQPCEQPAPVKEQWPHTSSPHPRSSSLIISPLPSNEQQLCEQHPPPARGDTTAANRSHQRSRCQLKSSCYYDCPRNNHSPRSQCNPRGSP
uniref:Uncharacterized protein n=1 Tax=Pipistrellus kuhlii TaxID=59472 RepID=A0A7J8A8R6_PIPKU|nr:hypothetical protein mPipKuh1_008918 [Pipistrellus kuhlii]